MSATAPALLSQDLATEAWNGVLTDTTQPRDRRQVQKECQTSDSHAIVIVDPDNKSQYQKILADHLDSQGLDPKTNLHLVENSPLAAAKARSLRDRGKKIDWLGLLDLRKSLTLFQSLITKKLAEIFNYVHDKGAKVLIGTNIRDLLNAVIKTDSTVSLRAVPNEPDHFRELAETLALAQEETEANDFFENTVFEAVDARPETITSFLDRVFKPAQGTSSMQTEFAA